MNETAKPRIGFIGLGNMGTPMCRHLCAAGYDVTAFVRNDAGRAKAAAIGATADATLAGLASRSGVVVSAISDDTALAAVVAGPAGIAAHMARGAVLIDTSTVSPAASADAAALLDAAGIAYLRSPVSGSTATAEAGQLTVLASGPRHAFDAALPLYRCFSAKQYHVGEAEQARYLKLALNAMVGATSALLAEALTLGLKGGLDMAAMLEVINNSAVASPLIGYKTKMLLSQDFTPAFPVTGMMKDFDIALAVGRSEHIPLPLIAQVRQQYEAAFANGSGGEDFFVLAREFARLAGLKR